MTKQFEPGKVYSSRSIVDYDTWNRIQVVSRTPKTIDVMLCDGSHRRKTLRLTIYEGVEHVKPYGNYSMCAIIGADDEGRGD